jgi:hypothetical protein
MTICDRDEELDALTAAAESPGPDFAVYSWRRVWKTKVLEEFCTDRPHL